LGLPGAANQVPGSGAVNQLTQEQGAHPCAGDGIRLKKETVVRPPFFLYPDCHKEAL
jgi:hypothetical protein